MSTDALRETRVADTLLEIFRETLAVPDVTLDSKFYALGGDSLLAVRVVNETRARGIGLSLRDLLVHQTVRALLTSDSVRDTPAANAPAAAPAAEPFSLLTDEDRARLPDGLQDALPASALQSGMLYLCETSGDAHLYHSVEGWEVCARFDEDRFRAALADLTRRHPALRTSFDFGDLSVPAQLIWEHAEPELRVESADSADHALRLLDDWRSLRTAAPLDWRTAPLARFLVVTLADSFHVALSAHHAVLDGWSFSRLAVDLMHLYDRGVDRQAADREAAVNARVLHDFTTAELAAASSTDARDHWTAQADDASGTLPDAGPPHGADASDRLELDLETDLVASLTAVARTLDTSLKSVLLAAHAAALGTWSGHGKSVVTGMVFNTRPESEGSDRATGLFLNTLPVRFADTAGSWAALIRSADQAERAGHTHRHYPQALLVEHLGRPAFQVVFNYMHFHAYRDLDQPTATPVRGRWRRGKPSFPFHVNVEMTGERGQVRIGFDPAFVAPASVEAYARTLHESLVRLAADPAGPARAGSEPAESPELSHESDV
ncbi:condensation domain-containing protein [Streptomyces sp. NPDC046261]|uniref:condensation domain-containing protein n=1 Tax=Streptomyces sp. NPDC046261 TaxID=3157200 RepID=UPI0033F05BBF